MLAHGQLGVHQTPGTFLQSCFAGICLSSVMVPGVIPPWRQDLVLSCAEVHGTDVKITGCETHGTSLFPKDRWTEYIECQIKDPLASHETVKPCHSLDWQSRNSLAELPTFGSHSQLEVSD